MSIKKYLRVASALTAGLVALNYAKQNVSRCYGIKGRGIGVVTEKLFTTSAIKCPKVYALDPYCNRILSHELRCSLAYLYGQTGIGDKTLLRKMQCDRNHRYHRLEYQDYLLYYDVWRRNPAMTYEFLTKESFQGPRCDSNLLHWEEDDRVIRNDYYKAEIPYVRGHMAARANHKKSFLDQAQTYFMTNASPQHCTLNGGAWQVLEEFTRELAVMYNRDGVHVFTGPVWCHEESGYMGRTKVHLPTHFFKVIIFKGNTYVNGSSPPYHVLSFLVPNEAEETLQAGEPYAPFLMQYLYDAYCVDKLTKLGLCENMAEWVTRTPTGPVLEFNENIPLPIFFRPGHHKKGKKCKKKK